MLTLTDGCVRTVCAGLQACSADRHRLSVLKRTEIKHLHKQGQYMASCAMFYLEQSVFKYDALTPRGYDKHIDPRQNPGWGHFVSTDNTSRTVLTTKMSLLVFVRMLWVSHISTNR